MSPSSIFRSEYATALTPCPLRMDMVNGPTNTAARSTVLLNLCYPSLSPSHYPSLPSPLLFICFTALPSRPSSQPPPTSRPLSRRPNEEDICTRYLGLNFSLPNGLSLILTADPGEFSGTPEAHHILANVRGQVVKPRSETVCGGVYFGALMGQDVVVATTGG